MSSEHLDLTPFGPRQTKVVAISIGLVSVVFFSAIGFLIPHAGLFDKLAFSATGCLIGYLLLRQARVRAIPSRTGLRVRNWFITTDLQWAQIVGVRFGRDHSWAQLDLSDGQTLAVMAIQQADGEWARQEAKRLANLVDRLSIDHPN